MPEYCCYNIVKSVTADKLKKEDTIASYICDLSWVPSSGMIRRYVQNLYKTMDTDSNYKSGLMLYNKSLFVIDVAKVVSVKEKSLWWGDVYEVRIYYPNLKSGDKKISKIWFNKNQAVQIIKPVPVIKLTNREKNLLLRKMVNYY